MLAAIVDWAALGKVVVYSFAAALVLTLAFTTGVLLVEARDGRHASAASRAVGYAAFAACAEQTAGRQPFAAAAATPQAMSEITAPTSAAPIRSTAPRSSTQSSACSPAEAAPGREQLGHSWVRFVEQSFSSMAEPQNPSARVVTHSGACGCQAALLRYTASVYGSRRPTSRADRDFRSCAYRQPVGTCPEICPQLSRYDPRNPLRRHRIRVPHAKKDLQMAIF
jgi:hypothetical protein